MQYKIEAKNKNTREYETVVQGEAESRRKFLKTNGASYKTKDYHNGEPYWTEPTGHVGLLVKNKRQWRCKKLAE